MGTSVLERSSIVKRNLSVENHPQWGTIADVLQGLPKPKPSDWGFGMTTCIAAICDHWRAIVLVTDQMLTYQQVTGEPVTGEGVLMKIGSIHKHWAMLSAGDIEHVAPVQRATHGQLAGIEWPTVEDVGAAALSAYRREYGARASAQLAHLGLNHESFLQKGRKKLGQALFDQHCWELKHISIGEFLIAGFETEIGPRILSISNPAEKLDYSPISFWAIGTGARMALDTLAFHQFNWRMSLACGIYHSCEAKFMSERAAGVGRKTTVLVMRSGIGHDDKLYVKPYELSGEVVATIRERWECGGAPKMPTGIEQEISAVMEDHTKARLMIFR